jgi:Protein of unknown function (DUF4232)
MRPARIVATVMLAAAVAITGCSAHPTTNRSAGASPPVPAPTTARPGAGPATPATTSPPARQPAPGRCAASALAGSVLGTEGTAGTFWYTVQLRNASAGACTVKGVPQVRLLGGQAQPVTAPSQPEGPTGSLVVLRPGQAARFVFHEPNACDTVVAGSRLQVTLPSGQGSLIVPLAAETTFGTCVRIGVRRLEGPTTAHGPVVDSAPRPVLADGHYDAYIRRVETPSEGGTSRLVVDLVQVFHDQAAVEAAIADGRGRDQARYLSVWVRNQSPRLRTLPLARDLRLDLRGGDCEAPASQQLAKLMADARLMSGSLHAYYFTLTVTGGAVHRIQEFLAINAC